MNKLLVLLLVFFVRQTCCSVMTCSKYLSRSKRTGFHLVKECAVSKMRIVGSTNSRGFNSCVKLATEKNAFAFAYTNQTNGSGNTLSTTCNVFECPEFHQFLLTTSVSEFNYYSMFSKPLPSENYTCAPGIGMFEMITNRLNYSNAMVACEDAGGHLANIVSDSRTTFLASLVSTALTNETVMSRKAFVGLFFENDFVTITGEPLSCLPFRAWAPGYPKASRLKRDCVVLTSNRYWQTEDCSIKLPYICELIPDGPLTPVERYCAPIANTKRRKNCILRNHKQFEKMDQTQQQCINNISTGQIETIIDNNY